MSDAVAVHWLDEGAMDLSGQTAAARALDEWAKAHGVALARPVSTTSSGMAVDLDVGDRVEQELARARDAISGTDADGVDQALGRAEVLLAQHPELPEAAWLRAEVDRSWASRWTRLAPRDEARARAAWDRAQALDGGRVSGIGELASTARSKSRVTFQIRGARVPAQLVLRVDGVVIPPLTTTPVPTYDADLVPAEHQIVVAGGGRILHAAWTATTRTTAPVTVEVTDSTACSVEELGPVRREGNRIDAAGVACGAWVVAMPTSAYGSLLVARCAGAQCEALVEWHVDHVAVRPPAPTTPERKRWPAWATWSLVGFGAAGAAVVGIVASGALQSRQTVPRFTVGGVRQE